MLKRFARQIVPAPLWQRLRRRNLRRHVRTFPRRTVEHTFAGVPLRVCIADEVSEGWYDTDWPSHTTIEFLDERGVLEGATVFDCGAHQGVVALLLAARCGDGGRIIAVEATAHNVDVAKVNVSLNPEVGSNVEIVHAALADRDGHVMFDDLLNGQISSGGGVRVDALSLGTMVKRHGRPGLILLDIEGAEASVLAGAADLIRGDHRPAWCIEVHTGHGLEAMGGTTAGVIDCFPRDLYELHWTPEDHGVLCRPLVEDNPLPTGRFHLLALPLATPAG